MQALRAGGAVRLYSVATSIRSQPAKSIPETVEAFEIPPLRGFWPTSGYVSTPSGESSTASASVIHYYTTGDTYWGTDGIILESSGDIGKYWGEIDADTRPLYVCATNDSVFIESFDGGLTWSKTDVHLT
jgi:hypothetical protein